MLHLSYKGAYVVEDEMIGRRESRIGPSVTQGAHRCIAARPANVTFCSTVPRLFYMFRCQ